MTRTRFFITAMLLLLSIGAKSQTIITFNAATDKGSNISGSSDESIADAVSKNGVTIACTDGAFATGEEYRFYNGSSTTISSAAGNIVEVVFHCTGSGSKTYGPGNFYNRGNISEGEYKYSGRKGTWKGNTRQFTIRNIIAQVRATSVEVTIDTSTGIRNVNTGNGDKPEAARNILGQRIAPNYHGVVIVGGKKVIVR